MANQDFFLQRPKVHPTIYAYSLVGVASHTGYLKVGFTERDVETRVNEQVHTIGVPYKIHLREFDLNVFFSAKGKGEEARFVYENEVQKWLDLIRGAYLPSSVDDMKLGQDKRPPMPYSDTRLLNVLSHTFWFLPNVASCFAMKNLLDQKQNAFFHDYKISVCAGTKAGIGLDALTPVQQSMGDPLASKTITLSCGKLTTGVTVKPWTGIFMLRNLKSPETYFQAAFRVQSPWTVKKDDGSTEIMKDEVESRKQGHALSK